MLDLSNLNILITGASKGIGYTLANILNEYGATVIGTYNNTKINSKSFIKYKCNLEKEKDIKNLFKFIEDNYKKIDVVVNCAAISKDNDFYLKTKKEFMDVLEINLVAPFLICKYASKIMSKGVIVNVASTNGIDTFNPISMDYDASKAGLINLTQNLALRFPNLKICAVAPNWVDTASTLSMDPNYLKEELERIGQNKLIKKETVALKILEIIINDDILSGEVVRIDDDK